MKSDVIKIKSDLAGRDEAMQMAEGVAKYNGFTGKNAMHISLLTEELVSMVHGIMDDFTGDLWIETKNEKGGVLCRICLSAKRRADPIQEEQFLSVSSTGENENAKGILGKIREIFRLNAQYGNICFNAYTLSNPWYSMGASPVDYEMSQCWSLANYRNNLSSDKSSNSEQWDELEKSIIAKLSDDVKVWLKSEETEVIVEKLIK